MNGLSELCSFERCVCAFAPDEGTAADVAAIPTANTKAVNLLVCATDDLLFTPQVIACSLLGFVAIHECA